MKMSTEESNVPIQPEDNAPERLELTGLRSVIDDAYGLRSGLGERQSQDETSSAKGKGSQVKGVSKASPSKAKAIPTEAKICLDPSSETHDSDSPENSKDAQPTLKRKKDDEAYDECMRNSYGFGNDNVAANESPASVHDSPEDDRSMMPPPKRFRYMRRNSFVIHRRHGHFVGIGLAIDTVSREHQTRQRTTPSAESSPPSGF